MNIIDVSVGKDFMLHISVHIVALMCIAFLIIIFALIKKRLCGSGLSFLSVSSISIGNGLVKVDIKNNKENKEVAYKIWVEMVTRKVGLPFDPENDVIVEVYNSWYEFFSITRDILKKVSLADTKKCDRLINITVMLLNEGMRPHLTKWQAKFRKWYSENLEENEGLSPQEIQKKYPCYSELIGEIIETNQNLVEFQEALKTLAFEKYK